MRRSAVFVLSFGFAVLCRAQTAPVVSPRGVVNAVTLLPAPSTVAPGGLVIISGLNLGPAEGARTEAAPWPTSLGDPPVEVFIQPLGGTALRRMPLSQASPSRIVAQVPLNMPNGAAQIVVRRGEERSRPALVNVVPVEPAFRSANGLGYGESAGKLSGRTLTLSAVGLGPTDPEVETGGAAAALPRATLRASVGGLPAEVSASLSPDRVGEFDVQIELPEQARPGDVISLEAIPEGRPRGVTGRGQYSSLQQPEVLYVPKPEGAPEFRGLVASDLRGTFAIASGARDESGCWPSYLFDLTARRASGIDACLIAANENAVSPVVASPESSVLAALAGPPAGDRETGISSKVVVFNAARSEPMTVELPEKAVTMNGVQGGGVVAVLPGTPPRRLSVDTSTGEVQEMEPAAPALAALNPANLQVDLGDGLTHLLSLPAPMAPGAIVVLVGDDANAPRRAGIAVLNQQGELLGSRDFPAGWVPLVAPSPPARPSQPAPGAVPGGALPGAQLPANLPAATRVTLMGDLPARTLYVLSRAPDNSKHALVALTLEDTRVIEFPAGWFAASCTANIPSFSLELTRRIALPGTTVATSEFSNNCTASGFLVLDLADQKLSAITTGEQARFSVTGAAGDLSDFIYRPSAGDRLGTIDGLVVLDGVNLAAYRIPLPLGVVSVQALAPVRSMNLVVGLGRIQTPGDAGLVVFDLDQREARLLNTPNGFTSISMVGNAQSVFPITRKVAAVGVKPDNGGSQFVLYDLATGDLTLVDNPPGVVWVGGFPAAQSGTRTTPAPGAPGDGAGGGAAGGAQLQRVIQNAKGRANTLIAVTYNARRQQSGVMAVRVH